MGILPGNFGSQAPNTAHEPKTLLLRSRSLFFAPGTVQTVQTGRLQLGCIFRMPRGRGRHDPGARSGLDWRGDDRVRSRDPRARPRPLRLAALHPGPRPAVPGAELLPGPRAGPLRVPGV